MKSSFGFSSLALLAGALAASAGCSSAPKEDSGARRAPAPSYAETLRKLESSATLAPGFAIELVHSADPKVSGKYEIEFDGRLKLPYKVTVNAAGLTPKQLEAEVERRYKSFYKSNNSVEIEVEERKYQVEVRGLVQKPGRYSVRVDTSLEELVSIAGGFPGSGTEAKAAAGGSQKPEYLRIVRPNFERAEAPSATRWFDLANYFYKYDTDSDLLWRGGETVYFQATADKDANIKRKWNTVTIMGEVNTPGEQPLLPGADLYTYVMRAGGPKSGADIERVLIIHRGDDDRSIVNMRTEQNFADLKEGDVIILEVKDLQPSTFEKALGYAAQISGIALSVFIILFTL
ncbi:MAG: SLBB domain-containing protein [Bdellovibrionales bacterium]|nr:SLBB domain-containing protein [Bdellovibrionales bacterium]